MLLGIGIFAFANPVPADQHHHHQQQQQQGRFPSGGGSSSSAFHHQQHHVNGTGTRVCLGYADVFIAFILIVLILATVFGNVLVVLSVFMYKRMRTFTNFLLTSLATADLLVGLLIMPLALLDLLHNHSWPLGLALCRIWATFDILLCTASILNLCIISLDRYMAITSPLRYPRTRSRWMACALLCFVWGMSLVVCSPPWFVDEWGISFDSKTTSSSIVSSSSSHLHTPSSGSSRSGGGKRTKSLAFFDGSGGGIGQQQQQHHSQHQHNTGYQCAYPMSFPYRIYSASVSFYIPLVVMLFVYFKIFRVASERERLIREGMGTCRLSRRAEKTQLKSRKRSATTNYTHRSSVPRLREIVHAVYPPSKMAPSNAVENADDEEQQSDRQQANLLSNHFGPVDPVSYAKLPPLSLSRFYEDRTTNSSGGAGGGQISPATQMANHHTSAAAANNKERPADDVLSCCAGSDETSCCPSARNSARGVDGGGGGGMNRMVVTLARDATLRSGGGADSLRRKIKSMECLGNLHDLSPTITTASRQSSKYRKNSAEPAAATTADNQQQQQQQRRRHQQLEEDRRWGEERKYSAQNLLLPTRLANGSRKTIQSQNSCSSMKQQDGGRGGGGRASNSGGGGIQQPQFTTKNANLRGSKEKIVYLRERKALKTIGIVVLGFILCWCPFFVVYIVEVTPLQKQSKFFSKREFQMLAEFFLWLGYSNSVLNPIIYTMYNSDFRRCFRDLLGFGCFQQHRRTMSVKKLHQQSTVF